MLNDYAEQFCSRESLYLLGVIWVDNFMMVMVETSFEPRPISKVNALHAPSPLHSRQHCFKVALT